MAAVTPSSASIEHARAVLGVAVDASLADVAAAFRREIKAARPELNGGDDARYREIIAAWAILKAGFIPARDMVRAPPGAPPLPVLGLSPLLAVRGGELTTTLEGRAVVVQLPAGVRTGDKVRLRCRDGTEVFLTALIQSQDDLSVVGDDLYMTWATSSRLIEDGGRLEIDTHAGPRSVWVVRDQKTLRFRLSGLGLPARGRRPRGHLFVTLIASALATSPAEDRLAQFTRAWTPDRLAA